MCNFYVILVIIQLLQLINKFFFVISYERKTSMKRKKNSGGGDRKRKKISWKDTPMIGKYGNNIHISSILTSITQAQRNYIIKFEQIFQKIDTDQAAVTISNEHIRLTDILSLSPDEWITDPIINGYMFLLQQRDKLLIQSQARTTPNLFFTSMLYTKVLYEGDHCEDGVLTWGTKKCETYIGKGTNIFQMNKIYFPINHNNSHWALVQADMEQHVLTYYDSLGKHTANKTTGSVLGQKALTTILKYLKHEHMQVCKSELQSTWRVDDQSNTIPQQSNGSDCGVFTIAYADLLSVDESLKSMNPKQMNETRNRIKFCLYKKDCYM